jgi:hypothetical protein
MSLSVMWRVRETRATWKCIFTEKAPGGRKLAQFSTNSCVSLNAHISKTISLTSLEMRPICLSPSTSAREIRTSFLRYGHFVAKRFSFLLWQNLVEKTAWIPNLSTGGGRFAVRKTPKG